MYTYWLWKMETWKLKKLQCLSLPLIVKGNKNIQCHVNYIHTYTYSPTIYTLLVLIPISIYLSIKYPKMYIPIVNDTFC